MIDKLDTSFDRCSPLMLIGWCNAASSWPKAHTAGVFTDLHLLVVLKKKGQLALESYCTIYLPAMETYTFQFEKSVFFFSPTTVGKKVQTTVQSHILNKYSPLTKCR